MQIYSWNMLFRNRELDRAFEFIKESNFDIFCLQEVPEAFLKRLQSFPCHLAYRVEVERLLKQGTMQNYVVTLSKYPITLQGETPFADYWPHLPRYTRLFVQLMPDRYFTRIRNRTGLFTDITLPRGVVRVFNLHLILAYPALRHKEFERAMIEHDPKRPAIVCGDFNILESLRVTPLNWITGGSVSDVLRYKRERTHMESRFMEYALTNTLRGSVTHPLSLSQLDHILVSHEFSIQKAEVISDRYGSDHHPIHVTTT